MAGEKIALGDIASFNCNGIGTCQKRKQVFRWLKKNHRGIVMLQESHSVEKKQKNWEFNLGKQYVPYFSHGTSGSCGVITYIPKDR